MQRLRPLGYPDQGVGRALHSSIHFYIRRVLERETSSSPFSYVDHFATLGELREATQRDKWQYPQGCWWHGGKHLVPLLV